jgi:hypothetical protein
MYFERKLKKLKDLFITLPYFIMSTNMISQPASLTSARSPALALSVARAGECVIFGAPVKSQ